MAEDVISGGLGGLTQGLSNIQLPWWFWLAILYGGILIVGFMLLYMFRHYNGRMIIFRMYNNKYLTYKRTEWVSYGRKKKENTKYMKLLKARKTIEGFEPHSGGRLFGGFTWFVVEDDKGFFHSLDPEYDSIAAVGRVKAIPQEILHAQISIMQRLAQRYDPRGFLEKYGVLVTNLTLIFLVLLSIVYIWDNAKKLNDQSVGLLRESMNYRQGQVVGTETVNGVLPLFPLIPFVRKRRKVVQVET